MLLSPRVAIVRNFAVAICNGGITLVILLIAPLGLAAVITNTFMVTVASLFSATMFDFVVLYVQGSSEFRRKIRDLNPLEYDLSETVKKRDSSDIERD
ncbi:MAG: CRISPR-associated protein Csx18 [Cyanobacteriota bacterium]